jgi:oxygen-independent coproporphyrinogen-3 oxidase
MYGLPGQTLAMALSDIERAVACNPAHVSHYQLTLEPNTAFAANPPPLPDHEGTWEMQEACAEQLGKAGLVGYEISAWCRPGSACKHNLNYWRFGDYLGIGAGAHGKLTIASEGRIVRLAKHRHPNRYLAARANGDWRAEIRDLGPEERRFEYFLNRLRLSEPIAREEFSACTGLPPGSIAPHVQTAVAKGLLEDREGILVQTDMGRRFNNDLQAIFLP